MQVKDIMTKEISLLTPESSLSEAAQKMKERDCGVLFVSEDDRLVGVVTDRDIVVRGLAAQKDMGRIPIKEVMTPKILYCYEDDSVSNLAQNMATNQVRRMPVLNKQKRLVGVVSLANVVRCSPEAGEIALAGICKP